MRLLRVVAPCALAAVFFTVPVRPQTPAPITDFGGVFLGESATTMVARLGEPLLAQVEVTGGISETDYLYLSQYGNALVFAHVVHGSVAGVSIRPTTTVATNGSEAPMPSALGVTLGDPASKVEALPKDRLISVNSTGDDVTSIYHGANGWNYSFTNTAGKIVWIEAFLPPAAIKALPVVPEPPLHLGTSVADAIALVAANETLGIQAEYIYVAAHPCAGGGEWHGIRAPVVHQGDRTYDHLLATCSTDASRRSFYFETTRILQAIRGL